MIISEIEGLRFKEKALFERKKKDSRNKALDKTNYVYPITSVIFDPLKKLKKKLARFENKYEKAILKKPVLAKRILKSAMAVSKMIEIQKATLVKA